MTGRVERMVLKDGREQPYTFIKGEDGNEYFIHMSAMIQDEWHEMSGLVGAGNRPLVTFDVVKGLKGLRAERCSLVR